MNGSESHTRSLPFSGSCRIHADLAEGEYKPRPPYRNFLLAAVQDKTDFRKVGGKELKIGVGLRGGKRINVGSKALNKVGQYDILPLEMFQIWPLSEGYSCLPPIDLTVDENSIECDPV